MWQISVVTKTLSEAGFPGKQFLIVQEVHCSWHWGGSDLWGSEGGWIWQREELNCDSGPIKTSTGWSQQKLRSWGGPAEWPYLEVREPGLLPINQAWDGQGCELGSGGSLQLSFWSWVSSVTNTPTNWGSTSALKGRSGLCSIAPKYFMPRDLGDTLLLVLHPNYLIWFLIRAYIN